jgi:hypothetical protein
VSREHPITDCPVCAYCWSGVGYKERQVQLGSGDIVDTFRWCVQCGREWKERKGSPTGTVAICPASETVVGV